MSSLITPKAPVHATSKKHSKTELIDWMMETSQHLAEPSLDAENRKTLLKTMTHITELLNENTVDKTSNGAVQSGNASVNTLDPSTLGNMNPKCNSGVYCTEPTA